MTDYRNIVAFHNAVKGADKTLNDALAETPPRILKKEDLMFDLLKEFPIPFLAAENIATMTVTKQKRMLKKRNTATKG